MGSPWLDVNGYAGPLDHLIEQARSQRLNLTALPLGELVDQLARAIETGLASRPLGDSGDWLVLGATLLHLRSALLLPPETAQRQAAERTAEALQRRIVLRATLADAAARFDRFPRLGRDVFARPGGGTSATDRPTGFDDLLDAAQALLRQRQHRLASALDRAHPVPPPYWTMTNAIAALREQMRGASPLCDLATLVRHVVPPATNEPRRARAAQAAGLMAALELSRTGAVVLSQDQPWGAVRLAAVGAD